jgi:hypothetical protein
MRIASSFSRARASRVMHSLVALALFACGVLLAGCGDGNSPSGNTGGTGSGGTSGGSDTLKLVPANNFSSTSSLTIPPVTVAAGADVKVCWDMVSKDIQGHAITPSQVNQVSFIPVNGTQDQVGQWLNTGQLGNDKITGAGAYTLFPQAGTTCANLSTFPSAGGSGHLDPASIFKIQDGVTYLIVFATGTQLGVGALTMLYLAPSSSNNTQTASAVGDSSSMLKYQADLHSLTPVTVDKSKPPVIDWSAVKTTGQGVSLDQITSILVGFYGEGRKVADLETHFLDLEQKTPAEGGPTQSWEVKVPGGKTAGLEGAMGRNGEMPLTSFTATGDGTWLMGLFCDNCQNPAPEIVTILVPQ